MLSPLEERFFISGEINSHVGRTSPADRGLAEHFADAEQHRLDGLSVIYPDWHFNVRSSNTEPLLRLNL